MASNSDSVREARRRRIAERGADRLALITGRIQTLPSLSSATSSSHPSYLPPPPVTDVLHPIVSDKVDDNDSENTFKFPQNILSAASNNIMPNDGESKSDNSFLKSDMSRDVQSQSSSGPPLVQQDNRVDSRVRGVSFFTPKKINSAISATESTRIYCSIAVAILVSLSYIGFPILANSITKGIIYYRPLYLVVITGISVVLRQLIFNGQGVQRPKRETSGAPLVGGFGSAQQLAKVLELGLCFKNITNALFMDFSVYAIVLVCFIAFAQKFGKLTV